MSLDYNLFKFATKEVSRSAFWPWVLECTNSDNPVHKAPGELGLAFLKKIGCDKYGKVEFVKTELKSQECKGRFDIHVEFDSGKILVIENIGNLPLR